MKKKLHQSPLKIKDKDDYHTIRSYGTELDLKKWCIQQSISFIQSKDTAHTINSAQKIYNWVTK